jgi:hypothetical protein
MVPAIHRIYRMDSQDLVGLVFYPIVATSSIFLHNWCCLVGGQAHSVIGVTACTDSLWQSAPIRSF